MRVPAKDLPGEWDRHLPKREKRTSPEWKPRKEKIGEQLWGELKRISKEFKLAYNLMMVAVSDLEKH